MRYASRLIALLIVLTGQSLSNLEYRGVGKKLQITAQRVSPAFAALEDTHAVSMESLLDSSNSLNPEPLYAGKPEVIKIALPKVQIASRSFSPLNEAIQKAHEVFVKSAPILVAGHNGQKQWQTLASTTHKISGRLGVGPQMFATHGYGTKRVLNTSSEKTHASKSINVDGVEVLIGGPGLLPMLGSSKKDSLQPQAQNVAMLATAPLMNPNFISSRTEKKIDSANVKRTALKGQIILSDGAVYPGESFNFYIQRVFDGMTQERGMVDPYTGEFEIDVNALKGKLTVELRHETGAAIAYGDLRLNDLGKNVNPEELRLKMIPTDQISVIGQVLSYESFDEFEVPVADGTSYVHLDGDADSFVTDRKGEFEEEHVAPGSQVLLTASHKGFWNTIELAEAGKPIHPILHSDKRMEVLMNLLEPYLPKSKIYSIIWGRVSHEGRPLSGARVTLQGYEDIQPLYFNFRIPNPKSEKTSEDGYFAFINPPEGLHILKATHAKVKIPFESTIVKAHHTSMARLETAPLKPVSVNIVEAFRGGNNNIAARVSIPGGENAWWLSPQKNNTVQFYDRTTPMPMDIDAGPEYVSLSTFVNRRRTHLEIPLVRKTWLSSAISRFKINIEPKTGMLMGMVEEGSHSVDLSLKTAATAVIYFNKSGEVVERITNGGGFVAINVPLGVVTASVVDTARNKSFKTLAMVESGRLALISVPKSHTH